VIVAALLFYFRSIIGPILLAFILTYLLHPVAAYFTTNAKIPWRTTVNLMYLLLVILLAVSITLTGLAVVQQIQNLIEVVQGFIANLPQIAQDISNMSYSIGPFELDLKQFELTNLSEQLLSYVQPLLTRVTGLVSTAATSAASFLAWGLFVLVISYFLLADASRVPDELLYVDLPGYGEDIRRLGRELRRTWNAFLRGQLILFVLIVISYTILMTILGVRYSLAIAILAGLARFVPYVGPFTTWTVTSLVTFFQGSNYFGLDPWQYTLLVIVAAILLDQIYDNIISPRLLGQTLGVHPAAVLIAAIIAANLIGIVGLVLAAPVLATLQLVGRYVIRKMFDLDPWPAVDVGLRPTKPPELRALRRLRAWYRAIIQKRTL